jgi:nucleoside-diphosphate kinase
VYGGVEFYPYNMIERTLSIIKPDATIRDISGKINSKFEEAGLKIIAQKRLLMTDNQVRAFYEVHSKRPFFESLINFMTSGPVIAQVLEGEGAVLKNREVMGATDPEDAAPGTVRSEYALDIERNSVHGSDSLEAAEKEVSFFFSRLEIIR